MQNDTMPSPNPNEVKPTELESPSQAELKTGGDTPASMHDLKTGSESNFDAPAQDVQKKSSKVSRFNVKLPTVGAAILAVLIVSSIVLGKNYFQKPDPSPAKTSTTSQSTNITVSTEPAKSAQDVIARVKAALAKAPTDNEPLGSPAPLHLDGYDFSVVPTITERIAFLGSQNDALAAYRAAKKVLTGAGLKAGAVPDVYDYGAPSLHLDSADVHCGLTIQPTQKSTTYSASVGCADTSDYEALAKKAQPFWNLYSAAMPAVSKKGSTILYGFDVKPSKTSGYATVEMNVGLTEGSGSVQLFYQTPDAIWHYFRGTQSELSCSDYNTVDLKKAYAGQKCSATGTDGTSYIEQTVQP